MRWERGMDLSSCSTAIILILGFRVLSLEIAVAASAAYCQGTHYSVPPAAL